MDGNELSKASMKVWVVAVDAFDPFYFMGPRAKGCVIFETPGLSKSVEVF